MNLHTQSHLTFEDSLTCTLTSKNIYSLGYSSPVTNDCSRKPFNDLPASVEPLSLPVPSGYIAWTADPFKLRDDEFYAVTNLSNYSRSYSDLRVLSIGLKFNPSPTHVERLILKEFLRRLDRNLRLREYFADSDSPVDSDTINFSNGTTETPPPSRIEA